MNTNSGRGRRNFKPNQPVPRESELIHLSFEGSGFLRFVFVFYSIFNSWLFSSLAEH